MFSYEEAGEVLDGLSDSLPEEIFEGLNGGIYLVEEAKTSEDGRYTLGTYFRGALGKYIELYYGSFVQLYGDMDDETFTRRLKSTLHHELTHHIEGLAGDRSLEHWDERQSELMGFNGIKVGSILFVCEDNTMSMVAEAVFNKYKQGKSADIPACSAGISPAEELPARLLKVCESSGLSLEGKRPRSVTRELLEAYDVTLCMTIDQEERLSQQYQVLDERFMCLAEDDLLPPTLPIGWKRCVERITDEVLAVIDELEQEDEL